MSGKTKRRIFIRDGVGIVPLSNGKEAIIDIEDIPLVQKYNWNSSKKKGRDYWSICANIWPQKTIRLSRIIMEVNDSEAIVDHINHNTFDNRKSNLRLCTNAQNSRNKKVLNRDGVTKKHSIYKGVTKNTGNRWKASIIVDDKSYHLGSFLDERIAAIAYNVAALHFYGEFAHYNKITTGKFFSRKSNQKPNRMKLLDLLYAKDRT